MQPPQPAEERVGGASTEHKHRRTLAASQIMPPFSGQKNETRAIQHFREILPQHNRNLVLV